MCPACAATIAMAMAGVTSTGGVAGLVIAAFRKKREVNRSQNESERISHGYERNHKREKCDAAI